MNIAKSLIHYLFFAVFILSLFCVQKVNAQEVKQLEQEIISKQLESQLKIDSLLNTIDTVVPARKLVGDSVLLADSIKDSSGDPTPQKQHGMLLYFLGEVRFIIVNIGSYLFSMVDLQGVLMH